MPCPQCNHPLTKLSIKTKDNAQTPVYECLNCGGHFLDSNAVNLIPKRVAKNIDSVIPQETPNHHQNLPCPICKQTLILIQGDSIPANSSAYACPDGHGNYFPHLELITFKNAQSAKINYLQIWGIPIKSAFAILLPIVVLFSAVSIIPLTVKQIKQRQEARVSASSIISTPIITPISSTQILLSFTTKTPATTKLILYDKPANRNISISTQPKQTHVITITNLQPNTYYTYTLRIKPESQKQETEISQYSFTTPSQ